MIEFKSNTVVNPTMKQLRAVQIASALETEVLSLRAELEAVMDGFKQGWVPAAQSRRRFWELWPRVVRTAWRLTDLCEAYKLDSSIDRAGLDDIRRFFEE